MTRSAKTSLRTAAVLTCAAMLLAGCGSGRDTELAEKMARAERAADRAEAAQKAAEAAAKSAGAKLDQIHSSEDVEPAPVEDEPRDEPVEAAGNDAAPPADPGPA